MVNMGCRIWQSMFCVLLHNSVMQNFTAQVSWCRKLRDSCFATSKQHLSRMYKIKCNDQLYIIISYFFILYAYVLLAYAYYILDYNGSIITFCFRLFPFLTSTSQFILWLKFDLVSIAIFECISGFNVLKHNFIFLEFNAFLEIVCRGKASLVQRERWQ